MRAERNVLAEVHSPYVVKLFFSFQVRHLKHEHSSIGMLKSPGSAAAHLIVEQCGRMNEADILILLEEVRLEQVLQSYALVS